MSTPTPHEMQKAMFMQLVIMLSSSAMQHLGKIINPMTGKTELNLEAAQATIDMVEMIEAKTRGNLDKDEERLLKNTITTLKLNYVETAAAPAPKAPEAQDSKDEKDAKAPESKAP